MKTQNGFTVLLMYPDYYADTYGETYLAHVDTKDPVFAVGLAQKACWLENPELDEEDLKPLVVFPGHLDDLSALWFQAQTQKPTI